MCECYQIGGPFIAEDPDCPVHGTEAQRERDSQEATQRDAERYRWLRANLLPGPSSERLLTAYPKDWDGIVDSLMNSEG